MNSLIAFFLRNRLFGDLLSVFLVVLGIMAVLLLRRETFPNVQFDVLSIATLYPGASPEEVEKLITNPIEQDLQEVDGIKKLGSYSIEGRSQIVIQLDPDQTTEKDAKEDVKSVIDGIVFPENAEEPRITALETRQEPIIVVAVSGEQPEQELRKLAKALERELEELPGVARVSFMGLRDLEIRVEVDPRRLRERAVSLDELVAALRAQNSSISAGTVEPEAGDKLRAEKIVRTIGDFDSVEDVERTVVRANELGAPIFVRDVAKVRLALEKQSVVNRTNGRPSIGLTVIKKEKADALRVVDGVRSRVAEFGARNQGLGLAFINDLSNYIRNRLSILSSNMIAGLLLILVTLALFLPFRVALAVSSGILISFFGAMGFFYVQDYSLNLISLLGLIIVSGMLVDDAIVVTDNIVRHMEAGKAPREAALQGTREIWPAVAASVLTTVVAFLPMMFMSGIFGKFVRQIPLGVVTALSFSLAEAVLLLPQHVAAYVRPEHFLRPAAPRGISRLRFGFLDFWENRVTPAYLRAVELCVRRRYVAMLSALILLVTALGAQRAFLGFDLFPAEGVEIFFVRTRLPNGVTLAESAERIQVIERFIGALPKEELDSYVTTVGLQQQDAKDPNTKRGAEYAQLAVYLTPENRRSRKAAGIIEALRKEIGKPAPFEEIRFDRVNPGPPVGKAVSLGVRAEEYSQILPVVERLKKELAAIRGVQDIADSYTEGKPEIQIRPIGARAAAAGLSVASIGTTVRAAVDGVVATSIQRIGEEVDVRVLFQEEGRSPARILRNIEIPNRSGQLIPLERVAELREARGVSLYEHSEGRREVKVTAELDKSVLTASEANQQIRETVLPALLREFPGVKVVFGGEDEDTQESLASLARAFLVAFLAIFLILVFMFKNLLQPFLVMLTIPMGITSVVFALILNRQPLSFMAMLGVIALAGVIVNNAIVLVDFVNQERAAGVERLQSILNAARIRLRPIFLTTITTVIGLLPTAHGIGGLDKFVVPIAISLGYGLLFGSILTAFLFPAAIAVLDDLEAWGKRRFGI